MVKHLKIGIICSSDGVERSTKPIENVIVKYSNERTMQITDEIGHRTQYSMTEIILLMWCIVVHPFIFIAL